MEGATWHLTRRGRGPVTSFVISLLLLASCASSTDGLSIGNKHSSRSPSSIISKKANGGASKTFTFDVEIGPDNGTTSRDYRRMTNLLQRALDISLLRNKIRSALCSTFLPSGYPHQTPPGYLSYSMWSWAQDLTTQMRAVLATQRVLEGVGAGKEGATALSASLNFIFRDGCGMLATLLFTSVAASKFRSDIKRWRLLADIAVDIGITLEVAAPLFPKTWFLPLISIATMFKAVCGVAAGAAGGAINLHWSRGSDISDINAKFGAQHTVTGGLGLLSAALFATSVSHAPSTVTWLLYALLTAFHIYANARCMRLVAFDSLNTARTDLLTSQFFEQRETRSETSPSLMDPETVSGIEPLFFFWKRPNNLSKFPILSGISFNEFARLSGESPSVLKDAIAKAPKDKYLVASGKRRSGGGLSVLLVFLSSATPEQRAKGYYHALCLCQALQKEGFQPRGRRGQHFRSYRNVQEAEGRARQECEKSWPSFREGAVNAGWDLSQTVLATEGYALEVD